VNNLIPAWAGKLKVPYRAAMLLRRIQNSDRRELLNAVSPMYINDLLYIGEESPKVPPHRLLFPVSIKCFSKKHLSGVDRIDKRLTPHRLAYIVFCSGEIVHESWVRLDALTPSQYGFDSRLPVIGYSFTKRIYRGYGIFPSLLNCILKDLKNRNITDRAYALVSPTNNAAIHGLEKADFQLLAHLRGTRLLGLFITNKSIERVPESLGRRDTKSSELPIAS
jgi:hypothetical protein